MDVRNSTLPAILLLTIFSSGFTSTINAADLSYTHIGARYFINSGLGDEDSDGFGLSGSYQLTDELFVTGDFVKLEGDDSDVEIQYIAGGGGYIYPLNKNWNADFMFSFGKIENDFPKGKDADDTGYTIQTGIRGLLNPQLELQAHVVYGDYFLASTSLQLAADYYLKPNISAGVNFGIDADEGSFSVGAKYYF